MTQHGTRGHPQWAHGGIDRITHERLIRDERPLPPRAMVVLWAVHTRWNPNTGEMRTGQDTLALDAQMPRTAVNKMLAMLRDMGLLARLRRERSGGNGRGATPDVYILTVPSYPASEHEARLRAAWHERVDRRYSPPPIMVRQPHVDRGGSTCGSRATNVRDPHDQRAAAAPVVEPLVEELRVEAGARASVTATIDSAWRCAPPEASKERTTETATLLSLWASHRPQEPKYRRKAHQALLAKMLDRGVSARDLDGALRRLAAGGWPLSEGSLRVELAKGRSTVAAVHDWAGDPNGGGW